MKDHIRRVNQWGFLNGGLPGRMVSTISFGLKIVPWACFGVEMGEIGARKALGVRT